MEGLQRRMSVDLPAERVDREIDKRLKQMAKTVKMHGFRPGKVPLSVIRRHYGGRVRQEVFNELVQSSFVEAVSQENLRPAGEPSIEAGTNEAQGGLSYTATFEVMPEISLQGLEGVTIKRPVVEVSESDIDTMIEKLRRQRVTWKPVERGAEDGDQLTVSFEGKVDGESFEGGSADGLTLILGAGAMVDGFEEALVGAVPGDSRTVEVEFPDNYRVEKLSGKPVKFEVQVSAVAEPELPDVDEEFARSFGVADGSVDTLRSDLRSNMEREVRQAIRSRVKNQVMDAMLDAHGFDVPHNLVQQEAERMREQARSEMKGSGHGDAKLDLPLKLFEEQAARRVKLGLIMADVVSQNSIEVDPDRLRSTIEELASSYEHPEEVVKWYYSNREQMASMESVVLEDQVVDWALERVAVEDVGQTFDELMNPPKTEAPAADGQA
jgi:trigger factor